jgi:hypothetical protein
LLLNDWLVFRGSGRSSGCHEKFEKE